MKQTILFFLLAFMLQPTIAQNTIEIKQWTQSDLQSINMPVFSDVENVNGETFKTSDLLKSSKINFDNKALLWQTINLNTDSVLLNQVPKNNLFILKSYLSVNRWTKGALNLTLNTLFEVYVDNKLVKSKTSSDLKNTKIELKLNSGNHKIEIKAITTDLDVKFAANFEYGDDFKDCNAVASLNSKHFFTIKDALETNNVVMNSISASGKYILVTYSKPISGSGKQINRTVIYDINKKKNVNIFSNKKASRYNWLPKTDRISYIVYNDKKASIYVYDVLSGNEELIAEGIKDLAGISWSPNEKFIVYTDYTEAEKHGILKRIYGSNDRLPYFRNRSYLYKLDIVSKNITRLVAGNFSSNLHDIKADGSKILFSTSRMDYTETPFSKQNLYEMDVNTFEVKTIWKDKLYGGHCQYSPDGKKLLVQGSPECFGKLGVNVSEGRIPNSYDSQLFLYDLATNKAEALTKEFDPAIRSANWLNQKEIYISVVEKDYTNVYRYDLKSKKFNKINLSVDVIKNIDFSKNKALAVYSGVGISTPNKLYLIDLKKKKNEILSFPAADQYKDIQFGKTEDWNFVNKSGTTIYGRIYYPPFYDANKKYPVIVNYYGGTLPISRSFGGRYPANIWAAGGYIVYILQPSGATGFGQDFSALHVNGWGFDAIDDIIDGTKKFLETHPTADKNNVGCIGASYGGYTTMLIQTRTDIFKTAVSHAGISSITSYWGEGYWGYTYNTIAAKFSYPWNRKDIFVENSPIYNADKFKNSILLLHGTADTNVPVGESLQYYAALKVLGKDVEMVLVDGENHGILDYEKRMKWHYTIMSWFDFKLKTQSQQWDNMYPKKNL